MMGTPIPISVFLLLSLLSWNSQAAGKSLGTCVPETERRKRKPTREKTETL